MPPVKWPLRKRRPCIEVKLPLARRQRARRLVADTGAGTDEAPFELLLLESDCIESGGVSWGQVSLRGAFAGWFNVYSMQIQVPKLRFAAAVEVVGVPRVPVGFDGIACFRFLNRFHFGNFGDANSFGLG